MQYTSSIPKTIQENYTFIASDPAAHGRLSGLQKKENELPEIALIRKRVIQTKAAEQSLKETSQGNFRLRSFFKVLLLGAALTPVGRLMKNLENSPTRFDYTSVNRALVVTNTLNNVRLPTDNTGDGQQEFSPWNTTGTTSPTSENLGGGTLGVTNLLNNVCLPTDNTGDGQQEFSPWNTTGTTSPTSENLGDGTLVGTNTLNNVRLPTNDTCVGQQGFSPSNSTDANPKPNSAEREKSHTKTDRPQATLKKNVQGFRKKFGPPTKEENDKREKAKSRNKGRRIPH